MSLVKLNDSVWFGFPTVNPTTGASQNADSLPTAILYVNGSAIGYSPTVTNLATGRYQVQVDCTAGNGFADLQQCRLDVTAVVAAVAGANTVANFNIQAVQMDDLYTLATLVSKILRNKFITSPTTGVATLYDDDSSTVLLQGQLYQDAGGLTKYQGQGAERRERLA